MYPKKIIVTNNDLLITVTDSENNSIKINANDVLVSDNVYDLYEFLKFKNSYFYMMNLTNQDQKTVCEILFNSNIAFSQSIPTHYINNTYNLSLDSSEKEIQKAVSDYIYGDKSITYVCNNKYDEIVAILYHFLSNNYFLKDCKDCFRVYLRKNKYGKYCERCLAIQEKKRKESKNLAQKEKSKEPYYKVANRTRQRLYREIRKTNEISQSKKFVYLNNLLNEFNVNVDIERNKYESNKITSDDFLLYVSKYEIDVKKKIKEVSK